MSNNIKLTSYILMSFGIVSLFYLHLMSALIGGMTMFILVNLMHNFIKEKIHSKTAEAITIGILTTIVFSFICVIGFAIYYGLTYGQNNYANLGQSVFSIVELIKNYIPENLRHYLPENFIELKNKFLEIIKKSLPDMLIVSKNLTIGFVHVVIGMLIGVLIAFSIIKNKASAQEVPLFKSEIIKRVSLFADIFHKVVFAQVKISAINTFLTALYLLVILPIFNINIGYAKTLVILTFLLGLIPVVGNLVTNTLITLLSLQVSFQVAVFSLIFLIVIHKLEYYINAKIIGEQIKTTIWEMLIVMLLFESVFGIMGAALSPVIYGYIKEELKNNKMI